MADEWTTQRQADGTYLFHDGATLKMRPGEDWVTLGIDEGGMISRTVPAAMLAAALRELGWAVTAPNGEPRREARRDALLDDYGRIGLNPFRSDADDARLPELRAELVAAGAVPRWAPVARKPVP